MLLLSIEQQKLQNVQLCHAFQSYPKNVIYETRVGYIIINAILNLWNVFDVWRIE